MTKYEDKVKEAYENNNLVDKIEEFKTDYANLDKAIEDLRAKFNADKEDNAAFKEYTELKKSLKDEYEKAHSAISAFKGITLYPDVYSSVILDWLGALYDIYDKACAKDYGFKDSVTADDSENIGVATVGISADIKALQDALAGYRKIVDDRTPGWSSSSKTCMRSAASLTRPSRESRLPTTSRMSMTRKSVPSVRQSTL